MYQQQPVPSVAPGEGAPPTVPAPGSPVSWRPTDGTQPWAAQRPLVPATTSWTAPGPQLPVQATGRTVSSPQLATPPVTASTPTRRHLPSSSVALLASLLVATAGVSFAVGRFTSDDGTASRGGSAALASTALGGTGVLPPAGAFPAGDLAVGDAAAAAPAAEVPEEPGTISGGAGTVPLEVPADSSEDTDAAEADLPALATDIRAPSGGPGGDDRLAGVGGPPGFGGIQGSVSAIEDGLLTIATSDGQSLSVTLDDATTYVRQTTIDAADLAVGDEVSVRAAGGGFGGGRGDAAGGTTADGGQTTAGEIVAGQVTLLDAAGS